MDAGLFIYFPRDPRQNTSIYFKVFDGQDIYLKKPVRPLTKKGPFPIVPTAILNTYSCPTGNDENKICFYPQPFLK